MRRRIALLALTLLALTACTEGQSDADRNDIKTVARQQTVYARNGQGVPFFDFSQDRETLRQIYVLSNRAIETHTIFTSLGDGRIVDDCPSIGYPIAADTQLTNPQRAEWGSNGAAVTLPQPEPNGLWTGQNTDATWVICVRDGQQVPIKSELKLTTYPYPVRVSADRMSVTKAGDASGEVETGRVVNVGETAPRSRASE